MKKNLQKIKTLAALLLLFCVSLSSCDKEPFTPEKKLIKIYFGNKTYEGKEISEEWFWEDNKVKKINYYYSGEVYDKTVHYIYEDNKLVKVTDNDGHYSITYSNSKISTIEYYRGGGISLATWEFNYLNGKISKIVFEYDSRFFEDKTAIAPFMSSFYPQKSIDFIAATSKGKSGGGTNITTYKYSGDNLKEVETKYPEYNNKMTTIFKSYDKMQNPYYKQIIFRNSVEMAFSKNNPLEYEIYFNETLYSSSNITYKYENEFPVEVINTQNNVVIYYEYE